MKKINICQIQAASAEAIEAAGGPTECAAKLEQKLGIPFSRSRVHSWKRIGIPIDFIIPMEEISGISRQRLNPVWYPD